ncbi:hypothetical protein FisN_5Lh313 [Fistulifera solaris]|uniref:Elongation of fatty acids protein n=1 Tax=Fistulifera solaris TaxID=1519565 RepID=A0A1Z5KFZ2_FISSO|nr:hypothetical protein FisN_5Lh313 [Fistulifera solaris]|eukprot:GAX25230.1 hypothetical protein FisN_5Lh313 [Fistulifera solaris]
MTSSALLRLLHIWRPELPESSDGRPLATVVSHFVHFPYDRLPSNTLVAVLMRPEVVLGLVIVYLMSKKILKLAMKVTGFSAENSAFQFFIAAHNLGLAVFSGVCAYNSWPIVIQHLATRGLIATYCDTDGSLWGEGGLGAWATVFYISKYYEFVDTWILVLKGKEASFLQVYHHTGIVLAMYGGVASQSAWLLFVVLLNSVIHTLMYVYFFIKTISPNTEIKAARYLTMAQIGQFFTGIGCSVGVLFMGNRCDTQSSRASLLFLHIYGFGLIALFRAFAKKKYKKN